MSLSGQAQADVAAAIDTVRCELRGLERLQDALAGELGSPFHIAVETLAASTGRVIVTGVGKSGHIARKLAGTLASTGKPAHFLHPSDASHGDLGTVQPGDVVLALSWSGESAELSDLVAYTRRFGIPLIGSTAAPDSALARAADTVLLLPRCDEACPDLHAPTTSTAMQLALGDALAVALLRRGSFGRDDFQHLHPGGRLGARLLHVSALMHTGSEVPLVPDTVSMAEAIVRMTGGKFGITGVLDHADHLVGVVTDGDLRRAFTAGFQDRPVREIMGVAPRVIAPDSLAAAALARMNAEGITSLFVVQSAEIQGILHIHDLLRAGLA